MNKKILTTLIFYAFLHVFYALVGYFLFVSVQLPVWRAHVAGFSMLSDITPSRSPESPWIHTCRDWTLCGSGGQISSKVCWCCWIGVLDVSKRGATLWAISQENCPWRSSIKGSLDISPPPLLRINFILSLLSSTVGTTAGNHILLPLTGDSQQRDTWLLHWQSVPFPHTPRNWQGEVAFPAAFAKWDGSLCCRLLGCRNWMFIWLDRVCWHCW